MSAELFPQAIIGTSTAASDELYFYEVGTTTDLTVYTDYALSTAHAQPVVADSDGLFAAIYLDASGNDPKVVLKDTDGNEKWTLARYPINDTATNATNIATNASDITTLQGNDTIQDADIDTLQTESADYESRITALEGTSFLEIADIAARLPCAYAFFVGENNPSFSQSYGFSGVTKNADGQFDLTFTTARTDANYVVVATGGPAASNSPLEVLVTSRATTGFRIETRTITGGASVSLADRDISVIVFDSNNAA